MSDRMERAMAAADHLWAKAMAVSPEFVERYLEISEELLVQRPQVRGDEFRAHCRKNGLIRPAALHHNVWVSGPRALNKLGWTQPMWKVEPQLGHNHMSSVTLWRSLIFGIRS